MGFKKTIKKACPFQPSTNGGMPEPDVIDDVLEALNLETITTELPPPHPPSCRKKDLFADASVFKDIDDQVIKVIPALFVLCFLV